MIMKKSVKMSRTQGKSDGTRERWSVIISASKLGLTWRVEMLEPSSETGVERRRHLPASGSAASSSSSLDSPSEAGSDAASDLGDARLSSSSASSVPDDVSRAVVS